MSISDAIKEGIRSIGKAYETEEPFKMISTKISQMQRNKK
jgi:hypothetical protein